MHFRRHYIFLLTFLLPFFTTVTHAQDSVTVPRFEYTDTCPVFVPLGLRTDCGWLVVPEDRTNPNSPEIRLAVAILYSDNPSPEPDPVVYLEGGPGGSALSRNLMSWVSSPILENRHLIVVDQRGTGYSQPYLGCEVTDQVVCHDAFLEQGINLAAYNSAASAADLEDLRLTLGYDEWNLFGVSYGTRLALTTMRDFPTGLRSVILDSVYPPEIMGWIDNPINTWRAFQVLFAGCAADPACNSAYPDLGNVFEETVARLGETPATFTDSNGEEVTYAGWQLVNDLDSLMYNSSALPYLPKMIYEIHDGQFETYQALMRRDEAIFPRDPILAQWDLYYHPYLFRNFTAEDYQAALVSYLGTEDLEQAVEALTQTSWEEYNWILAEIYVTLSGVDVATENLAAFLGVSQAEVPATLATLPLEEYHQVIETYILLGGVHRGIPPEDIPNNASSDGMYNSVECYEEIPFNSMDDFVAVNEAIPAGVIRDTLMALGYGQYSICEFWGAGVAPDLENSVVVSDVPTLILAGEYDPITPPAWSSSPTKGLTNFYYYLFPGTAHGVNSTACGKDLMSQFLNAPDTSPQASCLAEVGPPAFVVE